MICMDAVKAAIAETPKAGVLGDISAHGL